jgi:hypothetical protein
MGTLFVDKLDPQSGTSLEIGSSGDTISVPSGAELKSNKISPASGTSFTLGDSGDTFTIPSGVTLANSGTATGFSSVYGSQYFAANRTSDETFTNSTLGTIGINNEIVDVGGNYNTSNYRYTAPSTGYYFFYSVGFFHANASSQLKRVEFYFKKNSSNYVAEQHIDFRDNEGRMAGCTLNAILSLSSGDYIEWWGMADDISGNPTFKANTGSGDAGAGNQFGGWRVS